MSNEQEVFSFELSESLYFENGQGVQEMVGIALDPVITIQSNNDYVSIRGAIELKGEYRKVVSNVVEPTNESLDNFEQYALRYVETTEESEDGSVLFSHKFPVEISIPAYRVVNFNDINVQIKSFDYEIPEDNKLKLNSIIDIHGISSQKERVNHNPFSVDNAEIVGEAETVRPVEQEINEADAFEIELEQNSEEPTELIERTEAASQVESLVEEIEASIEPIVEAIEENARLFATNDIEKPVESPVSERVEPAVESPVSEHIETSAEIPISERIEPEVDTPVSESTETFVEEPISEQSEARIEDSVVEVIEASVAKVTHGAKNKAPDIITQRKDVEVVSEAQTEKERVEAAQDQQIASNYLSDMFKDAAAEDYVQMRLCIVQDKDTIETIAERYGILTTQILKYNHLETDDIAEGQVLYIPHQEIHV